MICNKCGNEVMEGQTFCSICGNKVESNVQQPNPQSFEMNIQNNNVEDQQAFIRQDQNKKQYEQISFEQSNNAQAQFNQVKMHQNNNGQYRQNNNSSQNNYNSMNYSNLQNNNQNYQGIQVPKVDLNKISLKPLDITFLAGAIIAVLSLFMTWVDVGIAKANGFQQQGYFWILTFVYPTIQIIRKQNYNKIAAIVPLVLGVLSMIYFISTKNTTVYGIKLHCARAGMYIMTCAIIVSLVASIIGLINEKDKKPKNIGPNMMPNYMNQNNMYNNFNQNNMNQNNMNQGNINYTNPNYNNMNQNNNPNSNYDNMNNNQ